MCVSCVQCPADMWQFPLFPLATDNLLFFNFFATPRQPTRIWRVMHLRIFLELWFCCTLRESLKILPVLPFAIVLFIWNILTITVHSNNIDLVGGIGNMDLHRKQRQWRRVFQIWYEGLEYVKERSSRGERSRRKKERGWLVGGFYEATIEELSLIAICNLYFLYKVFNFSDFPSTCLVSSQ